MLEERALEVLKESLAKVVDCDFSAVTGETDLIEDGIIDSLDSMSLLFEIEKSIGSKMPEISSDYEDFRVQELVGIISKYVE